MEGGLKFYTFLQGEHPERNVTFRLFFGLALAEATNSSGQALPLLPESRLLRCFPSTSQSRPVKVL